MHITNPHAKTLLMLLSALALNACSNSSWYNGMQTSHEIKCQKGPISEYDACMAVTDTTYDEYERERKALLK